MVDNTERIDYDRLNATTVGFDFCAGIFRPYHRRKFNLRNTTICQIICGVV